MSSVPADLADAVDAPPIAARKRPVAIAISSAVIAIMVLAAILAPLIAPHDPNQVNLLNTYAVPGGEHLFGTDSAGRDILSRLIWGTRLSLIGPLLVMLLATVVGVPLGLLAGYRGGWVDAILSRIFDLVFAFPSLLLAIVVVAALGLGFPSAVLAVSITYMPLMARVVRSGALVEREKPYVEAARLQGYGAVRICARQIGPALVPLIFSQLAVYFAYAMLDLAALSFLGLGTRPPTADWGGMLSDAQGGIFSSPTGIIPPAVAIVALVVAVSVLADRLTDRSQRR